MREFEFDEKYHKAAIYWIKLPTIDNINVWVYQYDSIQYEYEMLIGYDTKRSWYQVR